MDAQPLLATIAAQLAKHRLDAVMIGNAGAALQGSPVTTMDFDFMFRKTAGNLAKLKRVAADLDATVFRPYYPASQLYRITRDRDGLQIDFMAKIAGIRSFESLRARASKVKIAQHAILVADLRDISGEHSMKKNRPESRKKRTSLNVESERALVQQIRRQLALPASRRTNFLRVRLPNGESAL